MRILYIYKEWFDRFKVFGKTMERLGHDVRYCDLDKIAVKKKWLDSCDLIWIHKPRFLYAFDKKRWAIIKKYDIPIVTYQASAKVPYDDIEDAYSKFHTVFIPNHRDVYQQATVRGLDKFYYMPWGYDETQYYPGNANKLFDVSYAGSILSALGDKKAGMLTAFSRAVPTIFFGASACRIMGVKSRPYSTHKKQRQIYWSTKCNIGCSFTSKFRNYDPHQKARLFDVPACGEILLTNHYEELDELFEADKEMFFYNGLEEFIDKANWIVKNYDSLAGVREAARARCLRDHTFLHRFRKMFAILKERL